MTIGKRLQRWTVLEALSCLTLLLGTTMVAQERVVMSAMVRSGVPIVLEVPTGDTTPRVIQRVLDAAGVLYGIEHAPGLPADAPVDFGSTPERTMRLDGMRVSDALDAIVREDPRYEWAEVNGRVVVRVTTARGMGALDARVSRVVVSKASLVDALAVLVDAIDPLRPRPTFLQHGMSFEIAGQTVPSARPPAPPISATLEDATLLEILDALARVHGRLSWTVSYGRRQASLENASIRLMAETSTAIADAAHTRDEAASMRSRLMVPVMRSLDTVLSIYASRARILVGVELLPDERLRSAPFGPPMDLTNLAPAEALSRIVRLDSRFEWHDAGGVFNVRPQPQHGAAPSLLERQIDTLTLSEQTADGVLDALVNALGGIGSGSGAGEGGLIDVDPKEQARRMAAGRAKTISLTLTNLTLREILNSVCRAHGTLSWSLQPHPETSGARRYNIDLKSYDGWGVSRTFRIGM